MAAEQTGEGEERFGVSQTKTKWRFSSNERKELSGGLAVGVSPSSVASRDTFSLGEKENPTPHSPDRAPPGAQNARQEPRGPLYPTRYSLPLAKSASSAICVCPSSRAR